LIAQNQAVLVLLCAGNCDWALVFIQFLKTGCGIEVQGVTVVFGENQVVIVEKQNAVDFLGHKILALANVTSESAIFGKAKHFDFGLSTATYPALPQQYLASSTTLQLFEHCMLAHPKAVDKAVRIEGVQS
jgi:hypothetical protein